MNVAELRPERIEELPDAVRSAGRIRPRGGGTKPALSSSPDSVSVLEMSRLSGIVEYDPGEYTFTALAGTTLREIEELLATNGQHLPFDPPLACEGATLGGTVAAGLSGPGRQRFGGVRDFLIGVRFVDGDGRLIRGGGKVVKNAAGFDFPKLLIGSLGELGVLGELTFKVFPRRGVTRSVIADVGELEIALDSIASLASSTMELLSLELLPPGRIEVRVRGAESALDRRMSCVREILSGDIETFDEDDDRWRDVRDFRWCPDDCALVKVPTSLATIVDLEAHLVGVGSPRRYGSGGSVAWIAWPRPLAELAELLESLRAPGLVLRSPAGIASPLLAYPENAFLERVRGVLDAPGRFRRYEGGA
jgi:glycolate oxidase FAD binding subunit